jgi:uncharacterized membrane protein HdeD (DUF308 family)
MADQKAPMWLRILEIIGGIIVLVLGAYAIVYPGAAIATLILFLMVGLIVLGIVSFIRVFASGISGWRRLLNLILSVLVIIIAAYIIAYPVIYGTLTLVYLLGLALIFAGFASIARGTPGMIVVGVISIILGFAVVIYPPLGLVLAVILFAAALIIFGLEAIVSGIMGRWM